MEKIYDLLDIIDKEKVISRVYTKEYYENELKPQYSDLEFSAGHGKAVFYFPEDTIALKVPIS
jgi:hypothetical protein